MKLYTLILITIFMKSYASAIPSSSDEKLEDTLQLLNDGINSIKVNEDKSQVLFLGNTKSGVSSVVQILAGDNSKLTTKLENGNTIIVDQEGKIGSSIVSSTIIPTWMPLGEEVIFYDLPGINAKYGNRSSLGRANANIATSAFLNHVLSTTRRVKIILVIDAALVEPFSVNDKLIQFFVLVKKLVIDMKLYEPGIGVIVNKINSTLSDQDFVKKTVKYLRKLEDECDKLWLDSDEVAFVNEMINVLTKESSGEYKRIALMRVPSGDNVSIDNDLVIQVAKNRSLEMINGIRFIDKMYSQVGYSISGESRVILKLFANIIIQNMTRVISSLPTYVSQYYNDQTEQVTDIKEFIETTTLQFNKFISLSENIKNAKTVPDFLLSFKSVLLDIGVSVPDYIFNQLKIINNTVAPLEKNTGIEMELPIQSWIQTADLMKEECYSRLIWYKFILDLYDQLASFRVQTNRTLFNVKEIEYWGEPNHEQGLVIDSKNFEMFLRTVIPYFFGNSSEYSKLLATQISDVNVRLLNLVIRRTLRPQLNVTEADDTLSIVSDSITVSEALTHITQSSRRTLSIMALNSVIIDSNIRIEPETHLSIFAPNWISNGSYSILLEGTNANGFNNSLTPTMWGRAGTPGGSGGNFYGLAVTSNHLNLEVKSLGGKGSDGENGSAGATGVDNQEHPTFDSRCNYLMESYDGTYTYKVVYVDNATCGADGYPGGAGGPGGRSGYLKMGWLSKIGQGIELLPVRGERGEDGEGGVGGIGGATKSSVVTTCFEDGNCQNGKEKFSFNLFPPGKRGENGKSNYGLETVGHPPSLSIFAEALHQYKHIVSRYGSDEVVLNRARGLYQFLYKGEEEIYSLVDYFLEYHDINQEYLEKGNTNTVRFLYDTFLNNINKNVDRITQNDAGKAKALAHLATSVVCRKSSFSLQQGSYFRLEFEDMIQTTIEAIKGFEQSIHQNNYEAIKKHQESFKQGLNQEIRADIHPIYNFTVDVTSSELLSILNSKIQLVEDAIQDIQSLLPDEDLMKNLLEYKQKNLLDVLIDETVFGSFYNTFDIFSQLVVMSDYLLDVKNGGSSLVSGIRIGSKPISGITLPEGIVQTQRIIADKLQLRRNKTAEFLRFIHDDLAQILDESDLIMVKIEEAVTDIYDMYSQTSVQDVLVPIVKEIQERLYVVTGDNKELLYWNLMNVYIAGLPDVLKYIMKDTMIDTEVLNIINRAVRGAEYKLSVIRLFQNNMEYHLRDVFLGMTDNINQVSKEKMPGVTLDVTLWNVQNSLKNSADEMKTLAAILDVRDQYSKVLERIEDNFVSINGLYDRVKQWQDQEVLSDYIINIVSPDSDNIITTYSDLSSAVEQVDTDLKIFLVLNYYNRVAQGFHQWSFPFADAYMLDFSLTISSEVDVIIDEIIQRLNWMLDSLTDYYSRTDYEDYITEGDFTGGGRTTVPFVVWNNEDHISDIVSLLSGNPALFPSTLLIEDYSQKEAVKFTNIKMSIRLTEENDTLSKELEQILSFFDVKMTHLGNSYYQFNETVYTITNEKIEFSYSNDVDSEGQPVRSNIAYKKILRGEFMLSPYASWQFQLYLDNSSNWNSPGFEQLSRFISLIQVELIGHGKYVSPVDGHLPDLNLNKYYQRT